MNFKILGPVVLTAAATFGHASFVPATIIKNFDAPVEAVRIASLDAIGEARLGNRATTGDYELDVQDFTKSPSGLVTAQRSWADAQSYDLELKYTASTKEVKFTVGGVAVASALAGKPSFSDIFLRVRGDATNGIVTSVSDLALTTDFGAGVETRALGYSSLSSPQFGFNANAIQFGGVSPLSDFVVTGKLAFDWTTASSASGSRGAIQFKIGDATQAVPEPATLLGLAAGAAAFIRRRRRA